MRLSIFRNCFHPNLWFKCEVGKNLMTYYDSHIIPVSVQRQVMTIPSFSRSRKVQTFEFSSSSVVTRDLRRRVYVFSLKAQSPLSPKCKRSPQDPLSRSHVRILSRHLKMRGLDISENFPYAIFRLQQTTHRASSAAQHSDRRQPSTCRSLDLGPRAGLSYVLIIKFILKLYPSVP